MTVTESTIIELVKKDKDFESFYWVFKATRKKNWESEFQSKICIESGNIVGCDGYRLHVFHSTGDIAAIKSEYPSGVYSQVYVRNHHMILMRDKISSYPNWRNVIPDVSKAVETFKPKTMPNFSVVYSMLLKWYFKHIEKEKKKEKSFEIDYIRDLKVLKNSYTFYLFKIPEHALLATSKSRTAVIMPVAIF
jgi:hypothetical protein